jgi:hypothetical protein
LTDPQYINSFKSSASQNNLYVAQQNAGTPPPKPGEPDKRAPSGHFLAVRDHDAEPPPNILGTDDTEHDAAFKG